MLAGGKDIRVRVLGSRKCSCAGGIVLWMMEGRRKGGKVVPWDERVGCEVRDGFRCGDE